MAAALTLLLRARDCARDAGRSPWDFAVEMAGLTQLGLDANDLRWLVSRGYVECARETSRPSDRVRCFQPLRNLSLPPRACFVLTEAGEAWAISVRDAPPVIRLADVAPAPQPQGANAQAERPHWDRQLRVLTFGGRVVKRYRRPAPNQELILTAFQEEGWPHWIADPLPPKAEYDTKERLHDTIKHLNAFQVERLVHFRGDGTGEGIFWALAEGIAVPCEDAARRLRLAG